MSVSLEIRDGTPWYLSSDVWTVPGGDPEGAPGMPISGQPCYLWARVRNHGKDAAVNATVRFYWANPAVGFDRTTASLIGTANVTLPGGGAASEVLCLAPWVPSFVNGGHVCILAEAFHTGEDPLPATAAFDVPTDRHVAQRNLSLLSAAARSGVFHLAFEVHNPSRKAQRFTITTRIGEDDELKALVPYLGRRKIDWKAGGEIGQVGFVTTPCPDDQALDKAEPTVEVDVPPGGRVGLTVAGRLKGKVGVVHVEQRTCTERAVVVGGLAAVVVPTQTSTPKGA